MCFYAQFHLDIEGPILFEGRMRRWLCGNRLCGDRLCAHVGVLGGNTVTGDVISFCVFLSDLVFTKPLDYSRVIVNV